MTMRITLDALLVLDAIDRAGSFAGAAGLLFRVPSAVSYTIHKLEQDLAVVLFDRSGHRARLTRAGSQLLKDGRELLHLADAVERKVKQVGSGWEARLAIAVGDGVLRSAVYPVLRAFYEAPHEATDLYVTTVAQASCWSTLLTGKSDLVIGAPDPAPDVDGFRTQSLGEVELVLVMPPTHPLARAVAPLPKSVCSNYRFVRPDAWSVDECPHRVAEEHITVDDYHTQVDAIRHGLGIGYVPPYLVQEDVNAGRLLTKAVTDGPRLRLAVAWRVAVAGTGLQWLLGRLTDEMVCAQLVPRPTPVTH